MSSAQCDQLTERSWTEDEDGCKCQTTTVVMVPRAGLEPALLSKMDFESIAATNYATEASLQMQV